MAKLVRPSNNRYGILETESDLKPQDLFNPSDLVTPEISSDLGQVGSDIDISEYQGRVANLYLTGRDGQDRQRLNETRALNQSNLSLGLKSIGNVVSTFASELLKIPGYLGGIVADVATGNVFQGNFDNTVNNWWLDGVKYVKENTTDQLTQVYTPPSLENGSLTEQLSNPYFWAKEGADGVGFLLSFLVPGQALKGLGLGAKAAKTLAKTGFATHLDDVAKTIDSGSAVFVNTLLEAAAEGSGAYETSIAQGKSKEEAGKLASDVFKKNVAVLVLSNTFMEKYIFNGFGRLAGKKGFSQIIDDVIKGVSEIQKKAIGQRIGSVLQKVPASIAQEGLFEEGLQTSIEQTAGKSIPQVLEKYFENLGNMWSGENKDATDFGKAVILGGALGAVAGGFSSVAEGRAADRLLLGQEANEVKGFKKWLGFKDREQKEGLVSVFRSAYAQRGITAKDLFEYDEQGNRTGFKADLNERLQTEAGLTGLYNFYNDLIYKYNGDAELAKREFINELGNNSANFADLLQVNSDLSNAEVLEQVKNRQDLDYFTKFFEQESGKELLDEHIDTMADQIAKRYEENLGVPFKDKEKLASELKQKADKYFKLYDQSNNTATALNYKTTPFNETDNIEVKQKKKSLFKGFIRGLQRDLVSTLADIDLAESRETELSRTLNELEAKANNKGFADPTREASSQDNIKDYLSAPDYQQYQKVQKDITTYRDVLKKANAHYTNLTTNTKELFDKAFNKQESFEKKEAKSENATKAKVQEFQEKASQFSQDEPVLIEAAGKQYELTSESVEAPIVATPVLEEPVSESDKNLDDFIPLTFDSQTELIETLDPKVITKEEQALKAKQESDRQSIPETEPDENNYKPGIGNIAKDPFYQHALGNVPWHTRGISIAYRQDGYDETLTTEQGDTIPVANPSKYQQAWFNYTDSDIDKSSHRLLLINPKYDNSNEAEKLLTELVPEQSRSKEDVFVIVIDQGGNFIKYDALPLVNSLGKIESMFPANDDPKVNWFSMFNMYLKTPIDYKDFNSTKKATDFPDKLTIEKGLGKSIDNMTYQEVIAELKPFVRDYVENLYKDQYINPVLQNYQMEAGIESITNGFPIRILDSNGDVKLFDPKTSFDLKVVSGKPKNFKLVLSNTEGKLIVNGVEKAGFIPGITYLIKDNTILPLQHQKVNNDEIDIIVQLLATLADKPNLDVNIDAVGLGTMSVNNITYGSQGSTPIPLFPKGKNRFSLLTMIMNWGSKDKPSKYDIKIDKGNLVFGNKSLSLAFIRDNINDISKLSDLYLFLKEKNFHINKQLLETTKGKYYHPLQFKDGRVVFKEYPSYMDYILTRLNTEVAPKSYYNQYGLPQLAQRNINISKPVETEIELVEVAAKEVESSSDIETKKADIERRRKAELKQEPILTERLKEIGTIYAGNKGYININSSGLEVAENMKLGNITAEDLFNAHNQWGGKLYDWFNRGYKYITGKTFEEKEQTINAKYDAELASLDDKKEAIKLEQIGSDIKERTRRTISVQDIDVVAKDKLLSTTDILEDLINKEEVKKICP